MSARFGAMKTKPLVSDFPGKENSTLQLRTGLWTDFALCMVVAVVATYDPPVCLRLGLHGRAYAEKPAGDPAGFCLE